MKILKPEFVREDKRGTLIQFATGNWKQGNILKINKGQSFGGHYHKKKKEIFYVIKGVIYVAVAHIENLYAMQVYSFKSGDMFFIEPYDEHTIGAKMNAILVELLSRPYSKEDNYSG